VNENIDWREWADVALRDTRRAGRPTSLALQANVAEANLRVEPVDVNDDAVALGVSGALTEFRLNS